jgi:hypothetical protein
MERSGIGSYNCSLGRTRIAGKVPHLSIIAYNPPSNKLHLDLIYHKN